MENLVVLVVSVKRIYGDIAKVVYSPTFLVAPHRCFCPMKLLIDFFVY